jgi:hypothetical protein
METKLAMLENQLEAERRRNKLDFSNLDDKIRSEYAKRLVVKETLRSFLISCIYTVKKGKRFSSHLLGCHLPNSPGPGIIKLSWPGRVW